MGTYSRAGSNPPIVFISQIGVGGESWQPIIDRLPGHATFAYDRPGIGDALPRPAPNPALPHSAWAHELAALLDQHAITQPSVIVGHSFGGNIARVYAGTYPERVAGLVFVDASIPQTFVHPDKDRTFDGDGPDATEIDTVTGQVEILSLPLPQVPTVVMTRTPGAWGGSYDPPHPAVEDLWLTSQRLLARETGAPLVVTDNTGHQIPREAPDLVADMIDAVVHAVLTGEPVVLDGSRLRRLGGHLDEATSGSNARASSSDRYTTPHEGDAWAADAAQQGKTGTQRLLAVETLTPADDVRSALELTPGDQVVLRRRLILADNRPVEVAESYYAASIAAGTDLAQKKKIRGGAVRVLVDAGYPLDESCEQVTAERAGNLADVLAVAPDEPLIVIRRVSSTDGRGPAEYAVNYMVSARVEPLEYWKRNTDA